MINHCLSPEAKEEGTCKKPHTELQLIILKRDRVIIKYLLQIETLQLISFSKIKVIITYYKFLGAVALYAHYFCDI